MFEGIQAYSIISLISGGLCLFLALYVQRTNPFLQGSRPFILLMSLAAVNSIMDFLLINAPNEQTAMLFARPTVFFSTSAAAALLYLSHLLPFERPKTPVLSHPRAYAVFAIAVALSVALMVDSVTRDDYGWWASNDNGALTIWATICCAYCVWAAVALLMAYRITDHRDMRRLSVMLTAGAMIPPIYGLLDLLWEGMGIIRPAMLSSVVFATSIVFAYALFKQKLFNLEPIKEEINTPGPHVKGPPPGRSRLVEGKTETMAYRMFAQEVADGCQGLLITRQHPDMAREKYGFIKTPIIWLSTQPGQDHIDPHNLSILQHTVIDFQQKGKNSVILLDGLDYLVSYSSMDKVLRMLYAIQDSVVISGSRFILSIDPNVLDERSLALLEREFEIIRAGENGPAST